MVRTYKKKERSPCYPGSLVAAIFPFDDFRKGKLEIVCQKTDRTCNPLACTELEYVEFVRYLMTQAPKQQILSLHALHAGEMDEEGRFYVLDCLARMNGKFVRYRE